MSSVGVFRKVEDSDENSHWVFTWTPIDNDECINLLSSVWWRPPSTSFFCPAARIRFLHLDLRSVYHIPGDLQAVNSPPHFASTSSSDQQGRSLLGCNHDGICKLPVAHLDHVDNNFRCGACIHSMLNKSYYECLQCKKQFHKECVESPLVIKHPSHPFHSLRLSNTVGKKCVCCGITSSLVYHCAICEMSMHPICAMRSIPFVEDHPKSHPHPLTFFPTQASLVCHICGLIKNLDPTYICIQCIFVIHKGCIGFPHVIRISRHLHRISFTSILPSGDLRCGVCRKWVDNNYGAYSCSKGEAYFVHLKCALDQKIWDGRDLDGVPEEDDMIDDGEPFKRIADGIILHPFHSHNLQLEIYKSYDEKRYCRGCALPIHPHPLTLSGASFESEDGSFYCCACNREGTGFFYEHQTEDEISFVLDLRCASITEPLNYQGHEHPLFIPLDPSKYSRCETCKYNGCEMKLNCTVCDYIICFRCATFPYKIRYKHDNHFLTLCNGKEVSEEPEWCEVCEGKIEEVEDGYYKSLKRENRFYKCEDCSTALHIDCSLGRDIYMKPGESIENYVYFSKYSFKGESMESVMVQILLNSSLSRPICTGCDCRCSFPIVFQGLDNKTFCSQKCIQHGTW